jgi:hypothetical protein
MQPEDRSVTVEISNAASKRSRARYPLRGASEGRAPERNGRRERANIPAWYSRSPVNCCPAFHQPERAFRARACCGWIVEDITTELSRFRELFVIARNSSFHYKGRSVDVRQIGRELGVRYVLEGSIQRDCNRFRISAQLIDTTTGAHRWAERYDREMKDSFCRPR